MSIFYYLPSGTTDSPLTGFDSLQVSDLAVGLSRIRRFCGALETSFTVAQHSHLVSELVPEELAEAALFHDAHELFTNDVPSPTKKLFKMLFGADWEHFEGYIQALINRQLNLPHIIKDSEEYRIIHEADKKARYIEVISCVPTKTALEMLKEMGKEELLDDVIAEPVWDKGFAARAFLDRAKEVQSNGTR